MRPTAADTQERLAEHDVAWVVEPSLRRPDRLLLQAWRSWRSLGRQRPDVIVSAGTALAVPIFVAGRLRGIPMIWLETFNLIGRPGLAARLCSRLARTVLVQREHLVGQRRNAVYVGMLY